MEDKIKWYAMRVTYGREVKLKSYLDTIGIVNFIPMRMDEIKKGNKIKKIPKPIINNLIFIKSTRSILNVIKKEHEHKIPFRYIMDGYSKQPIVIPDKDMFYFIAVAGTMDEQLTYTTNAVDIVALTKGAKVRVTAGSFAGIEGVLVKIKRDNRVVVHLNGFVAITTAIINPMLIEKMGY